MVFTRNGGIMVVNVVVEETGDSSAGGSEESALIAVRAHAPLTEATELFPIVGIGASAGGLQALTYLLAEIPADTGMAYVVIQHLDPNLESQLPTMLAQDARIPIEAASDGCMILPDHAYIITPSTIITLSGSRLRLVPRTQDHQPDMCIDAFMYSLAADRPGNAIGIVLSGSGRDGTLGLAAIKAARGITFAQDDSAEYAAMPRHAIDNGHVDFVLSPAEIARELAKIATFGFPPLPLRARDPSVTDSADAPVSSSPTDDLAQYKEILRMLHKCTGIDFTHYRAPTITRRTRRRMALVHMTTLVEYERFLTKVPEELDALARDVLINVTSFYRDQAVFETLKVGMFPDLVRGRPAHAPIRMWIVGCSTGQEVYSLTIELLEAVRAISPDLTVQIFATDISDWALAKARLGIYPESIASKIPPDRLDRYFTRDGEGYRINKAVRELCVFAKHDVTTDTPFSQIDLISCRNVLIYMGMGLQQQVMAVFHFALKPGGFLLLGTAETLGRAEALYTTVDEKIRLYRSVASPRRFRPDLLPLHRPGESPAVRPSPTSPSSWTAIQRAADQVVIGRFAPAGVLITATLEIIQFRGHTNPYLEPAQGEASLNLLTMLPFAVAEALVEALTEAERIDQPVRREHLVHHRAAAFREIVVEVIPIRSPTSATCFLILFEEQEENRPLTQGATTPPQPAAAESLRPLPPSREMHLHNELAAATDYICSLVEENHRLVEQLKEAQEEAQSSTEEYRSTNEELQTTKEEIESTNEELVRINEELRTTNASLGTVSVALRESGELTSAVVETMRYPVLVLTADLHVASANQAFLAAFVMTREQVIGRLVSGLSDGRWDFPELRRLLQDIPTGDSAIADIEVTHDFGDIGTRTLQLNAKRLHGDAAGARPIVLVIADITCQARITKDLTDLAAERLRSNIELDQYALTVSHDLQEPLRMMSSFISMLGSKYGNLFDARAREYMSHVISGSARLSKMITAVLTYSRIGHGIDDADWIDSAMAFAAARDNVKLLTEESHGTITSDALPRLRASRVQLTQLFQNLLGNALKYRSGQRLPVISVRAIESDVAWTFSICDNGIGMNQADLSKVFQPFQRISTNGDTKGYGIGLATCAKIVAHHKGRIWAESVAGSGSTFSFTIPK
jgi:two-component system CheB/CheR fusion protein